MTTVPWTLETDSKEAKIPCIWQNNHGDMLQELQAKNEAANAKLKQMVKDQQEAEKKKVQSQEIQTEIEKQTIQIGQKQEHVKADLAQVEPAVIEAQQGL